LPVIVFVGCLVVLGRTGANFATPGYGGPRGGAFGVAAIVAVATFLLSRGVSRPTGSRPRQDEEWAPVVATGALGLVALTFAALFIL
jgi:hypothetical protein